MKLEELTVDERTALGRLIRLVARIDGGVSGGEREQIAEIAAEMGEADFWKVIAESGKSDWKFERCVEAVERQEVRELIYGVVLGIALVGTLETAEREGLEQIASQWGIEDVPEPPPEQAVGPE